jgi:hydroxymethylbilane synthase
LRTISGPAGDAFELGKTLARQVLDAGGKAVLDEVYGMGVRPKG